MVYIFNLTDFIFKMNLILIETLRSVLEKLVFWLVKIKWLDEDSEATEGIA